MSLTETNTKNDTTANAKPSLSPLEALKASFAKKGSIIVENAERDGNILQNMIAEMLDETGNPKIDANGKPLFYNWGSKAPEGFSGAGFVRTKETNENRLIAIASRAIAFADASVQDALYKVYLRLVIRAARNPESGEGQFITPSGMLAQAASLDAWFFQSAKIVASLEKKGMKIKANALKACLSNAQYAKALVSEEYMASEQWDLLLKALARNAEAHGYSSAIFAHWAATRNTAIMPDKMKKVALNVDELAAMLAEEDEDDDAASAGTE